jgi:hypothetical protein
MLAQIVFFSLANLCHALDAIAKHGKVGSLFHTIIISYTKTSRILPAFRDKTKQELAHVLNSRKLTKQPSPTPLQYKSHKKFSIKCGSKVFVDLVKST